LSKPKVAHLVTHGHPCPADRIAALEELLAKAKTGEVTSFVFVAVGPDFASWRDGFFRHRMDRLTLLGILAMAMRDAQDREREEEPRRLRFLLLRRATWRNMRAS
jgi:hypothetical protein